MAKNTGRQNANIRACCELVLSLIRSKIQGTYKDLCPSNFKIITLAAGGSVTMLSNPTKRDVSLARRSYFNKNASIQFLLFLILVILTGFRILDHRLGIASNTVTSCTAREGTKKMLFDPNVEEPVPKVAWLMTFPNSVCIPLLSALVFHDLKKKFSMVSLWYWGSTLVVI